MQQVTTQIRHVGPKEFGVGRHTHTANIYHVTVGVRRLSVAALNAKGTISTQIAVAQFVGQAAMNSEFPPVGWFAPENETVEQQTFHFVHGLATRRRVMECVADVLDLIPVLMYEQGL